MQNKRHSLLESALNIFSGSFIAYSLTQAGSWAGLWSISPGGNLLLTSVLTVVSLLRSYLWRRIFNKVFFINIDIVETRLK
jgi:hypothetical protein